MSKEINLLITIPSTDEQLARLSELFPQLNISYIPADSADDIPDELWEKTEVLFTFKILPEIEKVPNLIWLQSYLAGVDNLVDSPLFNDEDISVTTMSGANALQVSEHAVALLMALLRQIPLMDELKHSDKWPENKDVIFSPQEIRGSTVGIVGYGAIGREIARMLKSLGAEIVASKSDLKQIAFDGYIPEGLGDPEGEFFTRLYPPQALASMFNECDHVIVATPLTPKTKNLIGVKQLAALQSHSYLINISRGAVVDEKALISALVEGKIMGAGLDVFVDEPLPEGHPFYQIPNLIISPHVAGFSTFYNERAFELFITNLDRYIKEDVLYNLFDSKRGH